MMYSLKVLFIIVFISIVLFDFCATLPADGKYTEKYDNVDVDEIIRSDRLLKNYMNCLLDKGRCTPDAQELKTYLPDALESACSKCSEKQKVIAVKMLKHLVQNKRSDFEALEAKYDPNQHYRKQYQKEYAEIGIVF